MSIPSIYIGVYGRSKDLITQSLDLMVQSDVKLKI